jgi:hypothetical protein
VNKKQHEKNMSYLLGSPSRDNHRAASPPNSASSLRSAVDPRSASEADDAVCSFWLHCSQLFTSNRLSIQEGCEAARVIFLMPHLQQTYRVAIPSRRSVDRVRLALPDVLQDKVLNTSQRLSAHTAELLSLKRSGGHISAASVRFASNSAASVSD